MPPVPRLPVGVALSGGGTSLQNLLDRARGGQLPVRVVAVASSSRRAYGLERARAAGVPCAAFSRRRLATREAFSQAIFDFFAAEGAEIVVLAGFLKRLWLPPAWERRVLNIHPSLLPAFGGQGMYMDHVHEAVLAAGVTESGCSVHFVDDEYDQGPVLLQRRVPVLPEDTVQTLKERVIAAEREALPEALALLAAGRVAWDGDRPVVT